jgi:hypothetical protein
MATTLTELKNISQFIREYKAVRAKYIAENTVILDDTDISDIQSLTFLYSELMEDIEDYIDDDQFNFEGFESISDWLMKLSDLNYDLSNKFGYHALAQLIRLK